MKGRIPIFGILIILIVISFTPLNQGMTIRESYRPIVSRDTLYVGGSGPNNYTMIQYAIDDASNGDTVFVYEGTYDELIEINTTINLIGENKDFTIINGSEIGTVVTINADYVNINGFTIQNSELHVYAIDVKSDHSNISDNIFDKNGYGINTFKTDNHNIIGNIFYNHRWDCIHTDYSNNNIIIGNKFIRTGHPGIVSIDGNFNIISDNYFYFTTRALQVFNSEYIIINNNTFIRDTFNDAFTLFKTNYSTITNNSIFSWAFGLMIRESHHNIISGNYITDCYYDGIRFGYYSWDLLCSYNVIKDNIITHNCNGININDQSNNNSIYCNNISLNDYGINIKYPSSIIDNNFFHNNFYNGVNAFDGGSNIWNISYPSGGNYWSDYTGDDNNRGPNQDASGSDGIGDTALNISGGAGNKDFYPLMYPWGEQRPVANYTYFEELGGYIFNASLSYDRDGVIVSFEWDFGDGTTDSGMVVSHAYNASGEYDIILTVTDDEGYQGNLTETIDVVKNYPPEPPIIDGPDSGRWGKPYHFTFQSSDSEGSEIWYFVDWGDQHNTGWMGPYASGYELSDSHTWTQQETFTIRCKAKDMYNVNSDWAEFEITIPRTRASNNWYQWLFERFLLLERLLSTF
jgi:parallel beta-helix repeat protein